MLKFVSVDDVLQGFCYMCPLEHRKDGEFCEFWDTKRIRWRECNAYNHVLNARCIEIEGDYRELELPAYRDMKTVYREAMKCSTEK